MTTPSLVTPPPRPALALPPRPALRRGLWALPLLLSLAFVAGVLAWLRANEQSEREEQRSELISDALTLQAQVTARIEHETALLGEQERVGTIHSAELLRRKAAGDLELALAQGKLEQKLRELAAEVSAVSDKARAVSPDLIAALQAFGDRALAEKMAESMAPLAILGGESVSEVLGRLLRGTPLAKLLA